MTVYLTKHCRIVCDEMSFDVESYLVRKTGDLKGKGYWRKESFHASLEQASKCALRRGLARGGEMTIAELLNALEMASKRIALACEGALSITAAAELDTTSMREGLTDDLFD